jgi:hypothetical protein
VLIQCTSPLIERADVKRKHDAIVPFRVHFCSHAYLHRWQLSELIPARGPLLEDIAAFYTRARSSLSLFRLSLFLHFFWLRRTLW